jgi:IS5 family transposase
LSAEGVPDATTLLNFRRLLETHDLCKGRFTAINADLTARGLLLRAGSLVDATLIAAPSSTKNQERKRDPAMHQTRKVNQWYFGMKANIGADRDSKLVHTVVVTAAPTSGGHCQYALAGRSFRKCWLRFPAGKVGLATLE